MHISAGVSLRLLLFIITLFPIINHAYHVPMKSSISQKHKFRSWVLFSTSTNDTPDEALQELKLQLQKKSRELEQIELEMRALARAVQEKQVPIPSQGFRSKSEGVGADVIGSDGQAVPPSAIKLAFKNFRKELDELLQRSSHPNNVMLDPELVAFRNKLSALVLDNAKIWKREKSRKPIQAPLVLKIPYYVLCAALDVCFEGRPISRLYFLESVARIPYFSYITMLHTYETLGWWRRNTEQKRIHFAEEMNELNHLLIMEYLGGDQEWSVRFLAQHSSIVYYFVLIGLWVISPSLAYGFSELIESHAVDTYAEFAESNREILQSMSVPQSARDYWESADLYIFDEFQSQRVKGSRRPVLNNLYDVFCTIRDDEAEHVATMRACQDPEVMVKSPNTEAAILLAAAAALSLTSLGSAAEQLGLGDLSGDLKESIDAMMEAASGTSDSVGAAAADTTLFSTSEESIEDLATAAATTRATGSTVIVDSLIKLLEKLATFLRMLL